MANSILKKVTNKSAVKTLLDRLAETFNQPFSIVDVQHQPLREYGKISASPLRHEITVHGETFGWVFGYENTGIIADIIEFSIRQELEKRSLAKELLERYREIDLFYEISTKITASLNLKTISQLVLQEIEASIPLTSSSIWLLERARDDEGDGEGDRLDLLFQKGAILPWGTSLPLKEGILGHIVRQGRSEIVNDVAVDGRASEDDRKLGSLLCVPLVARDRTIGAMAVCHYPTITYSAEHLKLLTLFAIQTAIAIEKARLYDRSCDAAAQAQQQAQKLQAALQELQQAQTHLVQSEKMSSLGQMVAGVAHEINNPVNFINGNLSHACEYTQDLIDLIDLYGDRYGEPDDEIEDFIEEIDLDYLKTDLPKLLSSMKVGIDRIREIVQSLKNFSRIDRDRTQSANLHEGLDSTLLILNHRIKAKGDRPEVKIDRQYGDLPPVECFAGQLNQVFVNVIANAIDAMEEAGISNPTVTVRTQVRDDRWAVIQIADNGPGMADNIRNQIYDPFFTTKALGKGTGLGLAISRQVVVEKHGGRLDCRSQPGSGTQFEIWLPLKPEFRDTLPPPKVSDLDDENIDASLSGAWSVDPSVVKGFQDRDPIGYQNLVDRLARYNPEIQNFSPERIYQMLMSMPILIKLYLASIRLNPQSPPPSLDSSISDSDV
ncbi:ATP-binding protein [Baaleninema sp.]|uniref:GAF domain-containing sensor histidine kinase n=1 Tax=Baaleninema sp. TaxID=3101197 RepID=UPI003D05D36E